MTKQEIRDGWKSAKEIDDVTFDKYAGDFACVDTIPTPHGCEKLYMDTTDGTFYSLWIVEQW